MKQDELIRALWKECNTPAQKVRRLLKELGIKAKVSTDQMTELTDAGWRGGPRTALADVPASQVSTEQAAILHAVANAAIRISVSFVGGSGQPGTGSYMIRARG